MLALQIQMSIVCCHHQSSIVVSNMWNINIKLIQQSSAATKSPAVQFSDCRNIVPAVTVNGNSICLSVCLSVCMCTAKKGMKEASNNFLSENGPPKFWGSDSYHVFKIFKNSKTNSKRPLFVPKSIK